VETNLRSVILWPSSDAALPFLNFSTNIFYNIKPAISGQENIRRWRFDVRSSYFFSSFPFSFYDLNSSPSAPLYGNGNAGEAVTIARTAGSFKTAKLKDVPKVQGIPLL
jgi:hypothetical protein